MMSPEERRNRRIYYQAPVGGILLEDRRVLNMVSTNLSRSGMFVDLADVPPIGSELVCNLATSGGQSAIQIRGRITWHNGASGIGIEFVDLSDEQAEELNGIVGDGVEIPLGEQSAAVYELMELESADTCKTVVDDAVDAAFDSQIDEGMNEMAEMPSLDEAILLPATAPKVPAEPLPQYGSIEEPAFTMGEVRAELPTEDTDRIVAPTREPRSWLLAAAVGTAFAIAIGMVGFGLFGSDDSATDPKLTEAQALDGKRERVLALVGADSAKTHNPDEAIERIRAAALDESNAEHGSEAMAVGGPVFDAPETEAAQPEKLAPVKKRESKPAPKIAEKAVATQVKRQVLGGVVVRESSESFLLRLPFTGTAEKASHYVMNEPSAFAVNLPYAQPKKGYFQSLEPESDVVRLIWVRERLGGLHFRVFFKGATPTCDVETAKQALVLRCKS